MADTGHARSWRGESANLDKRSSPALVDLLAGGLRHMLDMPEDEAARIARGMADWMAHRAGGRGLYCPKTLNADRAARDEAIRREFNGRNRDALCRRHGIGKSTFYAIVSKQR